MAMSHVHVAVNEDHPPVVILYFTSPMEVNLFWLYPRSRSHEFQERRSGTVAGRRKHEVAVDKGCGNHRRSVCHTAITPKQRTISRSDADHSTTEGLHELMHPRGAANHGRRIASALMTFALHLRGGRCLPNRPAGRTVECNHHGVVGSGCADYPPFVDERRFTVPPLRNRTTEIVNKVARPDDPSGV